MAKPFSTVYSYSTEDPDAAETALASLGEALTHAHDLDVLDAVVIELALHHHENGAVSALGHGHRRTPCPWLGADEVHERSLPGAGESHTEVAHRGGPIGPA